MVTSASVLTIAVCPALPAHASLLTNGNMDHTVATEIVPGFFLPKPADWVNEGSRSISGPYEDELSPEPWAAPAPTPLTADGSGCGGPDCGVFFKPFTGNAVEGAATGQLYQDNPATPGFESFLSGWAGVEPRALGEFFFALDFLDAGNGVLSSAVLDLIAAGLFDDNGLAFVVDDFELRSDVEEVPEPGTIALPGLGLAGLGLGRQRKAQGTR